jgi:Glycosyltransferase family 28 C-terminal domain
LPTPSKINNPEAKVLKVLVAPLDWGLGHATRCVPIIKELQNQRCVVTIAASGAQKTLLQKEFPLLTCVEIPGYHIKYGKNRALTVLRLIVSIPKILIRVKEEKSWLRRFASRERPDLVLSDNRYGLYLSGTVCVFISHQLSIRTPFGAFADRLLQRINYFAIRRYSCCWVPDTPGADALAGKLSHPRKMPSIPTRYIGWLSRFGTGANGGGAKGDGGTNSGGVVAEVPFDVLVLLSGPEPQRTILEKMILEQAAGGGIDGEAGEYKIAVVRGLPGGGKLVDAPPSVVLHDHLPAAELESLICRSSLVLARSGYSTVMDLATLGKKAVYIPTPGQTEQEYLGDYLSERGWALCMKQEGFSLSAALAAARTFSFQAMGVQQTMEAQRAMGAPQVVELQKDGLLKAAIGEVLQQLRQPSMLDRAGAS